MTFDNKPGHCLAVDDAPLIFVLNPKLLSFNVNSCQFVQTRSPYFVREQSNEDRPYWVTVTGEVSLELQFWRLMDGRW